MFSWAIMGDIVIYYDVLYRDKLRHPGTFSRFFLNQRSTCLPPGRLDSELSIQRGTNRAWQKALSHLMYMQL